ncbi:class I SAM-dependent methyltransferase [Caldichromatium japonicum]|uniref:Class I SAM-dependent methyltransferase n=1 Tax=Caldichromatium japonicum TaxID=2699430 RepID=A0A6G7VBB4_9GAMM|nr:class I SAM-dependent methyltransferase [Caldichromatium japonicum]QIK37264.1 class I SAM-dependent methyltransferase [Caldichromatium japonicum]
MPGWSSSERDPFRLYQLAVQDPEAESTLIEGFFAERYGRLPQRLREDFCGTAALCAAWVRLRPDNLAWGVDLDPEGLAWGQVHNLGPLTAEQRRRIALINGDVRSAVTPEVDIVAALNFSYWLLKTRTALSEYLRHIRSLLAPEGLLILDVHGGPDAMRLHTERREIQDPLGEPFAYLWERADFDPLSHTQTCYIHFQFTDGTSLERAFSYTWRLWTLPELRELLVECGFGQVQVYGQGWDEAGNPDGCFAPSERIGPADLWIAYLVASPEKEHSEIP